MSEARAVQEQCAAVSLGPGKVHYQHRWHAFLISVKTENKVPEFHLQLESFGDNSYPHDGSAYVGAFIWAAGRSTQLGAFCKAFRFLLIPVWLTCGVAVSVYFPF